MSSPKQLTAFIREQMAGGASRNAIQRLLLSRDWTERDIDQAFAEIAPDTARAITAPHPLAGREISLSMGFIIISIVYILWQHMGGSSTALSQAVSPGQSYQAANQALLQTLSQITTDSNPVSTPVPAPTTPTAPVAKPVATTPSQPAAAKKPAGLYADGSYTGSPADAYYGTVQVKAVIRNGQLADVQFLQYPSDRSTSVYISSQAMPLLTQEAIQAQNAQVNGVSGATFTSQAFQQSLASALTLAKN